MSKTQKLQDVFFQQLLKDGDEVNIITSNGFQMRGIITGFDDSVVVLQSINMQRLIYKHAISTIVPPRAIKLTTAVDAAQ